MAGVREKLLTASDLATLCEVDLKTIHNWVDRGRIAHFRTPGRHLRFRAADVADFLRAWGYSVPRELARASSRTMLVVGTKETVALVSRALGETSAQAPAFATTTGPQAATNPGGPAARASSSPRAPLSGVADPGAPRAPTKAMAQSSEQGAPKPPIRQAVHPYDALVYAGADPADVYIIDVRAVAADIDVTAMLEALHRASPQGTFVALSEEQGELPPFAVRVARGEVAALRSALTAESPSATAGAGAASNKHAAAGASAGNKVSSHVHSATPAVDHEDDEDEDEDSSPRGVAVGGSSR